MIKTFENYISDSLNKEIIDSKFVSSKNGIKRYSEEGLETMKELFPDLVYKK